MPVWWINIRLYSRADEALWKEADAYLGMGHGCGPKAIAALQKIVRDYPLSPYADPGEEEIARSGGGGSGAGSGGGGAHEV